MAIERARQTVHRGRELLDQGKNEEAADLLRTIRAGLDLVGKDAGDEPRRLEALASSLLGQAISTRGDDRDAQHAFTYAIAIYEGLQELTAEEWAAFAAALHGVGKLDQAIDAQRMAVDNGEASAAAGLRLAILLGEAHRLDEAEVRLRGLVAHYLNDPDPAMALADMLDASGAADASDALTDAGFRLLQADRLEQALEFLNRARERRPSSPEVARTRALVSGRARPRGGSSAGVRPRDRVGR